MTDKPNPFKDLNIQWKDFLDGIPDYLLVVDREAHILYINRVGVDWQDAKIEKEKVTKFMPKKYHDIVLKEIKAVFDTGENGGYETEVPLMDGSLSWFAAHLGPVRSQGKVVAVIITTTDVTDRRCMEREIIRISDREQRRVGQDIHDGVSQDLTGIAFLGKVLEMKLADQQQPEVEQARQLGLLIKQAIEHTRLLARGLNPMQLETQGLCGAFQEMCDQTESVYSVSCPFTTDGDVLVHDLETATHIYRVAQEAIHNSIKHGHAKKIEVSVHVVEGVVHVRVLDNGVGLPDDAIKHDGMGLNIMNYRTRMIGGALSVQKGPVGGTLVELKLLQTPEE